MKTVICWASICYKNHAGMSGEPEILKSSRSENYRSFRIIRI